MNVCEREERRDDGEGMGVHREVMDVSIRDWKYCRWKGLYMSIYVIVWDRLG